jgi:lipoprotein NlpI
LGDLERCVALDPKCHKGFFVKGVILQEMQKFEDALDCFNAAIAIDSSDPNYFYRRSVTQRSLGNKELANVDMEKWRRAEGR